jgi:sugar fermentation stimulation protein A
MFPDAVTVRGQKHLDELCCLVECGHAGVIFFLIQRMDAEKFMPAEHIDSVYAEKLRHAERTGVRILAMDTLVTTERIVMKNAVPVYL